MGISSDAMLYFGFIACEEDGTPDWLSSADDEDDEAKDFDDFVVEVAGGNVNAPYEKRRPLIMACPAELKEFCSYEYPMFILAVRGAEHRVARGDFKEIGPDDLEVDQAKIDAFKAWCKKARINYKEPKWLLCSMYG